MLMEIETCVTLQRPWATKVLLLLMKQSVVRKQGGHTFSSDWQTAPEWNSLYLCENPVSSSFYKESH